MFRDSFPDSILSNTSPHARGDVPRDERAEGDFFAFSPRPWGCSVPAYYQAQVQTLLPTPVGMFRVRG